MDAVVSSSAVIDRRVFYDLSVSGSLKGGGCSAWGVFSRTTLPNSLLLQKASVLTLMAYSTYDLDDSGKEIGSCSNVDAVGKIVRQLTQSSVNKIVCDDRTWSVGQCANGGSALCVDCTDACDAQLVSSSSFWPTCVPGGSGAAATDMLRLLTVDFTNLSPAPALRSIALTATRSTIGAVVALDADGAAACAVYTTAQGRPSSVGSIRLQNNYAQTSSGQVSFSFASLVSAMSYNVYCATYSVDGTEMTLQNALATQQSITTACCRAARMVVLSPSVSEGEAVAAALKVSVSFLPSTKLVVTLSAVFKPDFGEEVVMNDVSSILFPASFYFTATSQTTKSVALLGATPSGVYDISMTLSGADSGSYAIESSVSSSIRVVSSAVPLSPPSLTAAAFSSNGIFVEVAFSAPTDEARLDRVFSCSRLFDFAGVSSASCRWGDASSVQVSLGASSTLVPGSSFTLKGGLLRARCWDGADVAFCLSWDTAAAAAIVVTPPTAGAPPVISLSAPALIGMCDAMSIDFSGSSGSGGRPWASAVIGVESDSTNISLVQDYVAGLNAKISGRVVVPNRLLEASFAYKWTVRLCNFLGFCSEGSARIGISNSAIPLVSILGQSIRSVPRDAVIQISSLASTRLCDGTFSSRNLQYSWTVYDSSGAVVRGVSSTSRDPKTLRLPPYSLSSDATYRVVSTVLNTQSMLSSSATAFVYVSRAPVSAVIAGSSSQSFRANEELQLDGSGSFDADDASAVLEYSWSCIRHKPSYSSSCGVNFLSSPDSNRLVVNASRSSYITESLITLTVSGAGGRVATASVTVSVIEPEAPLVVITTSSLKMNPSARLRISGYFASPDAGVARWSVDDGSVDLPSAALTPVATSFGERTDGALNNVLNLVLPAGSLFARSDFTFSLSYTTNLGIVSTASVIITTNGAPVNGFLTVVPENGTMLSTLFEMTSSQWQDEDLPITHEFSYVTTSDGVLSVVQSKSELSFCSAMLPSGLSYFNYRVTVRVQAFDSLGASASADFAAGVEEAPVANAQLESMLDSTVSDDGAANNDDVRAVIALVGGVLNTANCSAAPDCSSFHRRPCSSVDATCGVCLPGFVGEDGHSNTRCFDEDDFGNRRRLSAGNQSCSADAECVGTWQVCRAGLCVTAEKTCVNDCSGNGQCVHRSVSDASSWDGPCHMGNTRCSAVCVCRGNMTGVACQVTNEEMAERRSIRNRLIAGIRGIVATEDPDAESVLSWVSSLSSTTETFEELDLGAKYDTTDVARSILEFAIAASVPFDTVVGIINVVSSIGWTEEDASSGGEVIEASVASTRELLGLYSTLIGLQLVVGEDAVLTQAPTFSVVTMAADLASGGNVTVHTPLSVVEREAGLLPQGIQFDGGSDWSAGGATFSLMSTKARVFNSTAFKSDVLRFRHSDDICSALSANCNVLITLQNPSPVDYDALKSEVVSHRVDCEAGVVHAETVVCPGNNTITVHCNGSWAGQTNLTCPVRDASVVCNELSGVYASDSSCSVVGFTPLNTTCSCPLASSGSSQRRRLSSGGENSTTADVEFVAMLEYTTSEFFSTWQTADDLTLSSLEDSWEVLLTTVLALSVAVVGAVVGMRADASAAKRIEAEKNSLVIDKNDISKASKVASVSRTNSPYMMIEASLPEVLNEGTPFLERFSREVKVYHRWLGLIFYYSPHFTRDVRVLSLASTVIVMLFANAITYNTAYPDDGSCENYATRSECLVDDSSFSGESKCYWSDSGQCAFREPSSDLKQVVFVATIAALMSTPLAVLADYVIMKYIAADVKTKRSRVDSTPGALARHSITAMAEARRSGAARSTELRRPTLTGEHRRTRGESMSVGRRESGRGNTEKGSVLTTSLQGDMSNLVQDLREHRDQLTAAEREEFDGT